MFNAIILLGTFFVNLSPAPINGSDVSVPWTHLNQEQNETTIGNQPQATD